MEDVVDLDDGVGPLLADGDLVVRGPDRAARHRVDERQRSGEQDDVDGDRRDGDSRRASAGAAPPFSTSGVIRSGTATAKATPNQTVGGSSSQEITPSPTTPARLPARLIV